MFLRFAPRALWNPIRRPRVNAGASAKRVMRAAAPSSSRPAWMAPVKPAAPVASTSAPAETSVRIEQPGLIITVTVR